MASLNQQYFLGSLPSGLQFKITQSRVFCAPGGYLVSWAPTQGANNSNNDGRCFSNGNQFKQEEPDDHPGKTCIRQEGFSSGEPVKPVRLGEMKWHDNHPFNGGSEPGWIELSFQITKQSGVVMAAGKITSKPSKYKWLSQRPDKIDIELNWGDGRVVNTQSNVGSNFGIDPSDVYLMFVMGRDKKTLGMTFTQKTDILNQIANVAIQGLVYANKKMIEYGVPGGALIIKVVELPDSYYTIRDVIDSSNDFVAAIKSGNRAAALLAAGTIVKGAYDVGSGLKSLPGDVKGVSKSLDNFLAGKLPIDLNGLKKDIPKDFIMKIVDEGLKSEEARQKGARVAKLRRRRQFVA
ncbi:hypothetical protein TWF730_008901 [Orbilia blumenaviensis]|uniref:Uncharacterized protein n=1 Tax=Orbilia blumenaviensis TaxID=1796055 RepID=A0AAV9UY21_9PEZI